MHCDRLPAPVMTFTRPTEDKGQAVGLSGAAWLLARDGSDRLLRTRTSRMLQTARARREQPSMRLLLLPTRAPTSLGSFGFAGAWTVCEQNRLLAICFGLPQVSKA